MTVRQYRMLQYFAMGRDISPQAALTLNQRTFGSLCARGWVDYDITLGSEGCFTVTRKGRDEYAEYHEIHRANNNGRFSKNVPRTRGLLKAVRMRRRAA